MCLSQKYMPHMDGHVPVMHRIYVFRSLSNLEQF